MKVLLAFLLGIFFLAGTPSIGRSLRRPWFLATITTVVAASFYMLRTVQ